MLVAEVEALDQLHDELDGFWVAHPEVDQDDRMAFTLALAELVANIIEHGSAQSMHLRLVLDVDAVAAHLEDDGGPFPRRIDSSLVTDDPFAESGRGMALARHLAELSYKRGDDGNRWDVVRHLSAA